MSMNIGFDDEHVSTGFGLSFLSEKIMEMTLIRENI